MARGFKSGGRKKGTPNKLTREIRERMMEGETPLDYMIAVMRDEDADITRAGLGRSVGGGGGEHEHANQN
jgi:hypothetical protein